MLKTVLTIKLKNKKKRIFKKVAVVRENEYDETRSFTVTKHPREEFINIIKYDYLYLHENYPT